MVSCLLYRGDDADFTRQAASGLGRRAFSLRRWERTNVDIDI